MWYESFYSGDYIASEKILKTMSEIDFIDFDDIQKLIYMIRQLPYPTNISHLHELSKLTYKTLIRTHGNPIYHLSNEALLPEFLNCICQANRSIAKTILIDFVAKDSSSFSSTLKTYLALITCLDIIELIHTTVNDTSTLPTVSEIVINPLLFFYILQKLFKKSKQNDTQYIEAIRSVKENLFLAYRSNPTSIDIVALYISYLEATRKSDTVRVDLNYTYELIILYELYYYCYQHASLLLFLLTLLIIFIYIHRLCKYYIN
jgi:hypothetical protein